MARMSWPQTRVSLGICLQVLYNSKQGIIIRTGSLWRAAQCRVDDYVGRDVQLSKLILSKQVTQYVLAV